MERPLYDFYDYHIYFTSSLEDLNEGQNIVDILRNYRYRVTTKYNPESPDSCNRDNVINGINESCLCILYYTKNYDNDNLFNEESARFHKKADQFSDQSILVICKKSLDKSSIHANFKEYQFLHISDDNNCWENDFNHEIFPFIEKALDEEKNLKPIYCNNESFAPGATFGYYYGYLRLVLPEMENNFFKKTLGGDEEKICVSVSKLFIIIPEDCNAPINVADNKNIFNTDMFVNTVYNRSGVRKRDYKSSVYKIRDSSEDKEYYFIGEFATPLLTMYETQTNYLTGMTVEHLHRERDIFIHYLKSILNHPNNVRNKARIILWRNIGTDSRGGELLHDVLLRTVKEELMLRSQNSKFQSENNLEPQLVEIPTCEKIETPIGINPKAIYDLNEKYDLAQKTKGRCLAFIYTIDRKGSQHEEEKIRKLFTKLGFEVEILIDCTSKELEEKCLEYQRMDHSKYGAFVCCIASHGESGYIVTKDSKYEIIKIIECFYEDVCHTLKKKIKLFFINCCMEQKEDTTETNSRQENNNVPNPSTSHTSNAANLRQTKSCPNLINIFPSNSNCTCGHNHNTNNGSSKDAVCADNATLHRCRKQAFNLIPSCANIFVSYSCLPKQLSMRKPSLGSFYFTSLARAFDTPGKEIREVMLTLDENVQQIVDEEKLKIKSDITKLDVQGADFEKKYRMLDILNKSQDAFYVTCPKKLIYLY